MTHNKGNECYPEICVPSCKTQKCSVASIKGSKLDIRKSLSFVKHTIDIKQQEDDNKDPKIPTNTNYLFEIILKSAHHVFVEIKLRVCLTVCL